MSFDAPRQNSGVGLSEAPEEVVRAVAADGALPSEVTHAQCWPQHGSFCAKIYNVFSDPTSSFASLMMSLFITLLIIMSSITFILETLPAYRFPTVGEKDFDTLPEFEFLEFSAIICFTIEYLVRLFTAHAVSYEALGLFDLDKLETKKHRCCSHNMYKTWLFITGKMNLVDLLAILPYYIGLMDQAWSGNSLSVLRILRLARVFRVFKLGKYSEGALLYSQVLKSSAEALYLLIFFSFITSVVMGSLMYSVERGTYVSNGCIDYATNETRGCFIRDNIVGTGKEESPFRSIPQAVWWYVYLHVFSSYFMLDIYVSVDCMSFF